MASFSLFDKLRGPCEQDPQLPALIDAKGGVLSRAQLLQKARAIAGGFTAAGLQPGDRVLFAVRPDAEAALLMIAIYEAGGVLVPLDATMGPALFRSRMELLSPRWVVAESVLYFASANRWISRLATRRGHRLPPLAQLGNARFVRVGPALPGAPASLSVAALQKLGAPATASCTDNLTDDHAAMIVFTSGTTGTPRAVVHSRRSMRGVFDIVGSLLDTGVGDVVYAHEMHLILPALFKGSAVAVPGRSKFSARRAVRDLNRFRVTHFFAVAAELQQVTDYFHARNETLPHSVREIWVGAAPVHAAFLRRLRDVLPAHTKVWCVYGMTEILPVARACLDEKIRYAGEGDFLGECVPGVNARLAGDGELLLRGPNLFSGYLGQPPCVEHATGDFARMDDGKIVLLGRRKDMIIRGRFNIYPELYEPTIELIEGVQRCAMVGIYDAERADELVVLAVEPRAGCDAGELAERVGRELREGPCSIDAAALPDQILVLTLPVAGRSSKIDKDSLRLVAQGQSPCASR